MADPSECVIVFDKEYADSWWSDLKDLSWSINIICVYVYLFSKCCDRCPDYSPMFFLTWGLTKIIVAVSIISLKPLCPDGCTCKEDDTTWSGNHLPPLGYRALGFGILLFSFGLLQGNWRACVPRRLMFRYCTRR